MVWGAISWRGLGPLVTLHGKVKAAHYVNILRDQGHPFVQTSFPGECPLYQDDNAPIHTAKIVQEWFAEHEGKFKEMPFLKAKRHRAHSVVSGVRVKASKPNKRSRA
ncbi:transposable element Tcb2 transposase [Trichonephila clavipes]|nr:transposable element Tcb2 transposase [Trichonephila clavipes]